MENKQYTIRELIKFLKWTDVYNSLKYFYPDDKNNYEPIFDYLGKVKKQKHKDPQEEILILGGFDEKYPEDSYYGIATNKYSLSFRKWKELANIPISRDILKYRIPVEIVAHFIWEITFYGNEQDIAKKKKELYKTVSEFKNKKTK